MERKNECPFGEGRVCDECFYCWEGNCTLKKEGRMMQQRTLKEFKIFEEEAKYWVDFFKLYNWYIKTIFSTGKDIEEMRDDERDAWALINHEDHMAVLFLNKTITNYKDLENEKYIRLLAFHEVCEVLLFPLTLLAEDTYSERVIIKNTHIIINHLENSVFEGKHGNTKRNDNKA